MANVDAPRGLTPVKYSSGAPYNGAANAYFMDSGDGVACFVGDCVTLEGGAGGAADIVNGIRCEGMATVATATAGDAIIGVVVGFAPNFDSLAPTYRLASTNRIVYVIDNPDVHFEIQEDSAGAAITAAQVGLSADVLATAGSTTTGRSAFELDSSSAATAAGQFRIVGLVNRPGNVIGDNANWIVSINEHQTSTLGSSTDV